MSYVKNFNNFIDQLKVIFSGEETQVLLDNISKMSDDNKLSNGLKFVDSFDNENFGMFVKSKIKVFSHKVPKTQVISESLFGEKFCLKNLLNNQPDEVKNIIWTNLHTIYMKAELEKPIESQNQSRLEKLLSLLKKDEVEIEDELPEFKEQPTQTGKGVNKKIHDMLGVNINKETSSMIDEIVGSFEKIMKKGAGTNPMSSIMEISKLISVKYADKINDGTIEIDKLMEAIGKKIPGMDKVMDQVMGMMKDKKDTKPKEKIIIDENFSTSSIQVGKIDEDKKSFDIGKMLKMADQFGVIPGGKKNDSNMGEGLASLLGGMKGGDGNMADMSKLMSMMQKMDGATSPEKAEELKQEMDSFMQKELGVDISQLNEQLDSFTTNVKEATEATQENNKESQ